MFAVRPIFQKAFFHLSNVLFLAVTQKHVHFCINLRVNFKYIPKDYHLVNLNICCYLLVTDHDDDGVCKNTLHSVIRSLHDMIGDCISPSKFA